MIPGSHVPAVPAEAAPAEDRFTALFIEREQALVAGETADLAPTPTELQERMERDLACVHLLQQALGPPAQALPPGQAVPRPGLPWTRLGRFELSRELGCGGFGIVYLAYDPLLQREVAVKVPRLERGLSPE